MQIELLKDQPFTEARPDMKQNHLIVKFDEDLLNDEEYSFKTKNKGKNLKLCLRNLKNMLIKI